MTEGRLDYSVMPTPQQKSINHCAICLMIVTASPLTPSLSAKIFDECCSLLRIDLTKSHPKFRWHFPKDAIPFCRNCLTNLKELVELRQILQRIQNSINAIEAKTKIKIFNSSQTLNSDTSSNASITVLSSRKRYFRSLALKGMNPNVRLQKLEEKKIKRNIKRKPRIKREKPIVSMKPFVIPFDRDFSIKPENEHAFNEDGDCDPFIDYSPSDYNDDEDTNWGPGDLNGHKDEPTGENKGMSLKCELVDPTWIPTDKDFVPSLPKKKRKRNRAAKPQSDKELSGNIGKLEEEGYDSVEVDTSDSDSEKNKNKKAVYRRKSRAKVWTDAPRAPVEGRSEKISEGLWRYRNFEYLTIDEGFKCKLCDVVRKRRDGMHRHIDITHDETAAERYKCQLCGKGFSSRRNLVHHEDIHKEANYQCSECGLTFKQYKTLYHHQKRVHLKIRGFKCDLCEKRFYSGKDCRRHIKTHSKPPKQKSYTCDSPNCDFTVSIASKLKQHKLINHNVSDMEDRSKPSMMMPAALLFQQQQMALMAASSTQELSGVRSALHL